MNSILSITTKDNIFLYYLLLFPFLMPRGFLEYSLLYKVSLTIMLMFTSFVALVLFIKYMAHTKKHKYIMICTAIYYLYFVITTFMLQGRIGEGLQKLFIAPVLFFVCQVASRKHDIFIICISNILILNFALNISVFNPIFWTDIFNVEKHIIFLGHVQTVSQLGVVGIFLSYILSRKGYSFKSKILLFLSVSNMLLSDTSASYLSLLIFALCFVLLKISRIFKIKLIRVETLLFFYLVINYFLFEISNNYMMTDIGIIVTEMSSGRPFIWKEASNLLDENWLFGYGAYGALIKVFWSKYTDNPDGMNYAHNEVFQRLLDGGIILLLLFLTLLYAYINNINKIRNYQDKLFTMSALISFFVMMLFESVTEYYFYIFLISLFYNSPNIFNINSNACFNKNIKQDKND